MWVILISWSVALFEYIFQVPANRTGSQTFSLMQLKIMQECITLVVFTVIAYFLFDQTLKWNNLVSYAFIIGAVYFSFAFYQSERPRPLGRSSFSRRKPWSQLTSCWPNVS